MRLLIRLFMFLCLVVFLTPINALAEDNMDVSIDYGIDGKIQIGRGFPMTVTLTNQGETISGDLVIFSNPNYETLGNIVIPVEILKGEEITVKVSVPGYENQYYNQPNNDQSFVRFYKDGWEKGEEVSLKGNTDFRPSILPENRVVIGTLSETPDALNALKIARYNGESVEFVPITQENISDDSTGLEVFDVLLINDYNISNLSDQQLEAIKDWIRSGGHLMLGSDPSLQQHMGTLNELFLLDIEGQTSFNELNFFPITENDVLPGFENVEIQTGNVSDNAKVLYSDHSLPMVLNKSFGMGEVTQFAFNLGSETLANWEPYTAWWSEVLQQTVDKDQSGQQRYLKQEFSYRMGNVVESYPSSFIPVKTLVILFIVYLVLLIPGLYFILKKLDKREISWIIIPAVAILSSIAIFIVGAKDRLAGTQINNVSILSIDDSGIASGYGAISILTNNGGDYSLTIKPEEFKPFPRHNFDYNSSDSVMDYAMVERGHQQSKLTFNDVEYWSIRSAVGDIKSLDTGKLTTDLRVENSQIIGTVTSPLSFNLDEAFLLTGSKAYSLGEIKAGSTIDVQIELDGTNIENWIGAPRSTIASNVIPGYYNQGYGGSTGPQDRAELEEWKQFELLDTAMTYNIHQRELQQPLIAGYTSDPITEVEIEGKQTKSNSLALITQPVQVEIQSVQGEFKLSGDSFNPNLSILEGNQGLIHHNGLLFGDNFVTVEQGKYQLSYQMPVQMEVGKLEITKLKLRYSSQNGTTFHLYNNQTKEYVALDESSSTETFEETAAEFISENGTIILMFEKNEMGNPEVNIPTLELEGEYNND